MMEDIAHGATFEQLAGLDPARWAVVAVDLKTGTIPGARTGLVVYAVDLAALGVIDVQDRRRVLSEAASRQSLPVTRFVREDLGLADMLAQMKTAHVHFRAALYRDTELHVETPTTETPTTETPTDGT